MKTLINTALLAAIIIFSVSCKKENDTPDPTPQQVVQNMTGLGDNSGLPTGTQYVLPSFVSLIGDIRGGIYSEKSNRNVDKKVPYTKVANYGAKSPEEEIFTTFGTGTYVDLYIKFFCTLDHDTTFNILGGLIFVDTTGNYQSGFVLQTISIPLVSMDTTFALVRAYCLNLSRHSSDYDAVFKFGPVTNNASLMEVVNVMKIKQPPVGNESGVQDIIWNISDFDGITNENRTFLNSLP
jgi:hypothetical protein